LGLLHCIVATRFFNFLRLFYSFVGAIILKPVARQGSGSKVQGLANPDPESAILVPPGNAFYFGEACVRASGWGNAGNGVCGSFWYQ
jgi:hypothetical protein